MGSIDVSRQTYPPPYSLHTPSIERIEVSTSRRWLKSCGVPCVIIALSGATLAQVIFLFSRGYSCMEKDDAGRMRKVMLILALVLFGTTMCTELAVMWARYNLASEDDPQLRMFNGRETVRQLLIAGTLCLVVSALTFLRY